MLFQPMKDGTCFVGGAPGAFGGTSQSPQLAPRGENLDFTGLTGVVLQQKGRLKVDSSDIPACSMYGIFTYIWVFFRANVGKYTSTMEHMG